MNKKKKEKLQLKLSKKKFKKYYKKINKLMLDKLNKFKPNYFNSNLLHINNKINIILIRGLQ